MKVRLEFDGEADAAYFYLVYPVREGEAKNTVKVNDNVLLDFDSKGRLLGVEVLNASKLLAKEALADAVNL